MKILLLALIYGGILLLAHWRGPERVPEAQPIH
jgi:hypothetical protein